MESQRRLWKGDGKYPHSVEKRRNRRRKQVVTKTKSGEERKGSSTKRTAISRAESKSMRSIPCSIGKVDSRLTSSAQLSLTGHQVPRAVLSRPSSARGGAPPLRRPHTSPGFRWNKSSHQPYTCTAHTPRGPNQGFDLVGYVKRLGTTEGIQIGINGTPVDIRTYLEKCEENSDDYCFNSDIEEDIDMNRLSTVSEGNLLRRQVPLCWEDQLKIAEVNPLKWLCKLIKCGVYFTLYQAINV